MLDSRVHRRHRSSWWARWTLKILGGCEDHGDPSGAKHCRRRVNQTKEQWEAQGAKKAINSELWHACTGPLVCLPQRGSLVYYFPQRHSEQVAATTNQEDAQLQHPQLPEPAVAAAVPSP